MKFPKDEICLSSLLLIQFLVYFVCSVMDIAIGLGPSLFRKERLEYNDAFLKIVCCGKKWQIGGNIIKSGKLAAIEVSAKKVTNEQEFTPPTGPLAKNFANETAPNQHLVERGRNLKN